MIVEHGIRLVFDGVPPAKSNSYRIVRNGSFCRVTPTAQVKDYEQMVADISAKTVSAFGHSVLYPAPTLVEVSIVWYRNNKRRADLDNIAKSIHDGLTQGHVWDDDRQVVTLQLTQRYTKGIQEHVVVYIAPLVEEP